MNSIEFVTRFYFIFNKDLRENISIEIKEKEMFSRYDTVNKLFRKVYSCLIKSSSTRIKNLI